MKERTNISLQLLFLNDILRTNVIDQNIYEKAVQKINTKTTTSTIIEKPVILASA